MADTFVAIDAPLIIINETGQRVCETAVGKRYGSREASCHTTNLPLYPGAASVALTAELMSHGFVHVNPATPVGLRWLCHARSMPMKVVVVIAQMRRFSPVSPFAQRD